MGHANARLTPFGRLVLVQRVLEGGWAVGPAAEAVGVSRTTAYKWLRRYREEGETGLRDRAPWARSCPHALPQSLVERILRTRRRLRQGPHRLAWLLGLARSTIYGVLRRHGISRLQSLDRSSGVPIRYCKERPGELLHLDVKKLGRIPAGGGHRKRGRARGRRHQGGGYDFLHVAVDDASRVAYVAAFPDERGQTTARFLLEAAACFADRGVGIERVMTDRAFAYTRSRHFRQARQHLGAGHSVTRPYRPQTNGKAERFIRTLLEEWAYTRLYRSNQERLAALQDWVQFYNRRRPHTALKGQPPMAVLVNNVRGNYS